MHLESSTSTHTSAATIRKRSVLVAVLVLLAGAAIASSACAAVDGPTKKPSAHKRTKAPSPIPSVTLSDPGVQRLVVLLGGSSARECIVSDAAWAKQITGSGGGVVKTFDLGSRNESFSQDLALVRALPKAPGVVFVGVTVGRFTGEGGLTGQSSDARAVLGGAEVRHQYTEADVLSAAAKKVLVKHWVSDRYPLFQANYTSNMTDLQTLVEAIAARGYRAVLLQLPLNRQAIGTAFDPAVNRYVKGCKALAAKNGIPWIDFVADLNIPSADFYDLFHLVEPGRVIWQRRLSDETVTQLRQVSAKQ